MKHFLITLLLTIPFITFSQSSSLERKVYDVLNTYKLNFNSDTTVFSEDVSVECRIHSQLMVENGDLFHADGGYIGEIVQKNTNHYCNENVYVCNEDELAQKIITSFLNSPPHKKNLEKRYKRVGVGIIIDEKGGVWVTIRFW
jgi:uncharacterized protein YkwD